MYRVTGQDSPTLPLVTQHNHRSTKYLDLELDTRNDLSIGRVRERNLGVRLETRKKLMKRRRWLVNLEFLTAMSGIVLMVTENELYFSGSVDKDSWLSFLLKFFISLTTLVLLITIGLYYQAGIALRMFDGRVDDPFAVTPLTTWLTLGLELMICAIHPPPGNIQANFQMVSTSNDGTNWLQSSVDGVLSVLMMLRLYIVGKFIVVHSQILTHKSTQTVSGVSHVKININFVLKAALNNRPTEVIAFIMITAYSVCVWSMRTCELYYTPDTFQQEGESISEAMWLSAITFLTVGYGDEVPRTQCGRFVAVVTALMGIFSTAMLVAVIAKRLQQSHNERYVYNFLSRIHLQNRFKAAAADVVKFTVKLCTLKRHRDLLPIAALDRTLLQWKLRTAIRTMRSSRAAQADIEETSVGFMEVCQLVSRLDMRARDLQDTQGKILQELSELRQQMTTSLGQHDGS